jgi:hypothetical protein
MVLAAAGGLLVLLGGILLVATARRAAALSSRYDRAPAVGVGDSPAAARAVNEDDLWKALDAGLDPTGGPEMDQEPSAVGGEPDDPTPSEVPRVDDYDDPPTGIAGSGPELSNERGNRRRPHR